MKWCMLFLGFNLGKMYDYLWLYKKKWKGHREQACTNPQCCGIKIQAQHQNVWIERVKKYHTVCKALGKKWWASSLLEICK